jgi:hypothetical protein
MAATSAPSSGARVFIFPVLIGIGTVVGFGLGYGFGTGLVVAMLAVLETSLSFDNAVVNATVLRRMSRRWQSVFLTLGVVIAVIGMRLLFPFLVVAITTHDRLSAILTMAVEQPDQYAAAVQAHHPAIASFGGAFLFMIFLEFIVEQSEISWLSGVRRALAWGGWIGSLCVIVALVTATFLLPVTTAARAGTFGVCTFLAVAAVGGYFQRAHGSQTDGDPAAAGHGAPVASVVGWAAFLLFIRLEILDASFSFDGVIGAFAISSNIFIIMIGLGIGALFVRALTVFLVREGTLNEYVYLERGAHYAIGALGILLGLSVVPALESFMTGLLGEIVTGLAGMVIIALAFALSVRVRRRDVRVLAQRTSAELPVDEVVVAGEAGIEPIEA